MNYKSSPAKRVVNLPRPEVVSLVGLSTTSTSLTITSSKKITSLSITNLLGQTVYNNIYNTDKVQIDVADLPKGLYFIKVNGSQVQKFLKE
jgi:hypothetical protein